MYTARITSWSVRKQGTSYPNLGRSPEADTARGNCYLCRALRGRLCLSLTQIGAYELLLHKG